MNDIICCDFCGEEYHHVAIIKKPSQFAFKGKIYNIPQLNHDGRESDNTCLECFDEQIKMIQEN